MPKYIDVLCIDCNGSTFASRTEQAGLLDRLVGCRVRESKDSV